MVLNKKSVCHTRHILCPQGKQQPEDQTRLRYDTDIGIIRQGILINVIKMLKALMEK